MIFDADHTLYDINTAEAYDNMFEYLANELKAEKSVVERVWREHVRNLLTSRESRNPDKRRRDYALYILLGQFDIIDDSDVKRITNEALEVFWHSVLRSLRPKKGLNLVLAELRKRFTLCVASDEFSEHLEKKLDATVPAWRKIFRMIVTPEKTGVMKPSRRYYSLILLEVGVKPEECVVVGDSWQRDLRPAKQLGMKTVLIAERKEGSPDAIISNISELPGIIDGL